MIILDDNDREVEILLGGSHVDEIEINEATYLDSGESVDIDTIDELKDYYYSELQEEWLAIHGERLEYDYRYR